MSLGPFFVEFSVSKRRTIFQSPPLGDASDQLTYFIQDIISDLRSMDGCHVTCVTGKFGFELAVACSRNHCGEFSKNVCALILAISQRHSVHYSAYFSRTNELATVGILFLR